MKCFAANKLILTVATAEKRFLNAPKKIVGECVEWLGMRTEYGYGRFHITKQKIIAAHRFALQLKLGRMIKRGFCACHTCDNPPCVNQDHLWEGTKKENTYDAIKKGRMDNGPLSKARWKDPAFRKKIIAAQTAGRHRKSLKVKV